MLSSQDKIVVVGTGQAGVELAVSMRGRGHVGPITLIGEEPEFPYQRPPLSKHLLGSPDEAPLPLQGAVAYQDKSLELRLGVSVTRIYREEKLVGLSDGGVEPYDHLVIATGSRNRIPPVNGLEDGPFLELRTLADARRLLQVVPGAGRVAIIGGGFIGLELAAMLRQRGISVELVESASRLMSRALSVASSDYLLNFHRAMGTKIHLDTRITQVRYARQGATLILSDGRCIDVDQIVVAAGIQPNEELASAAGLSVSNGVLVDAQMATDDPAISSIGDCAAHPNPFAGDMIVRLESVQNAADQARTLAARLTGEPHAYRSLPWFWSVQRNLKVQIAGLSFGHDDTVVRGDVTTGSFSFFLYTGNRLTAVESFNMPRDHMLARKILDAGVSVAKEEAADSSFELRELVVEHG